jgi:replicative DNA helicase
MPPWDEQAEKSVLGAMLLTAQAVADASELLTAEDFYRPAHQAIYLAAVNVQQAGEPVDAVTLSDELGKRGLLGKVGGAPYLLTLVQDVPTAVNAAYYARIVAAKAMQRRLIEAGTRIAQMGYAGADETAELVERARSEVDKLVGTQRSGDTLELVDLIPSHLDELEQPIKPGYPSGFTDLDEVLGGGFHPGTLTVVGARPGLGKSILALRFAAHVASLGYGALVFSLEMSRSELMGRFFAAEASVELSSLHQHRLSTDDWRRVHEAAERAKSWPLAVADVPRIGITGITSRARDRTRTSRGLALVVVDYLQLVTPSDTRANREQQIAGISRGLKLLARELQVPVVAAAQVNRGPEQRADRKPALSDLRESGAIEADADTVLLLHDNAGDESKTGRLEVIVAKNRHGPRKSVELAWAPYYATARNLSRYGIEEAS